MTFETAPISPNSMTYDEAVMYCFFCNHNGYRDWRMPTYDEYYSIDKIWGWWTNRYLYERVRTTFQVTPVRTTPS